MCKHRAYGCIIGHNEKKKAHVNEVSKYYRCNGKSKDFIALEKETRLRSITISEMGGIGKLMINWSRKYGIF